MRKANYLLLALFFIPVAAIAQKKDTFNLVIRTTGGYTDVVTSTETGVMHEDAIKTSTGVIDFSTGLLINKRFEIGVEVEYLNQKTVSGSFLYLPDEFYANERTESNVKMFLGKIYAANHWQLWGRLYFAPKLALGIGKANGTIKSHTLSISDLKIPNFAHISNSDAETIVSKTEKEISYNYYAMGLTPAFNFYFNKHFALTLETGTFQLSLIDSKWESRQWLANISPIYWNLGFVFVL